MSGAAYWVLTLELVCQSLITNLKEVRPVEHVCDRTAVSMKDVQETASLFCHEVI